MARTGVQLPGQVGAKPNFETAMTDCGGCIISASQHGYPSPAIIQSCKDWQTTLFYVKSPDDDPDLLNLPEFKLEPPLEKYQWSVKYGVGDCNVDAQVARIAQLFRDGLQSYDHVA